MIWFIVDLFLMRKTSKSELGLLFRGLFKRETELGLKLSHMTDDLMSQVYKISLKKKPYWLLVESERWRVIVFSCVSNGDPNNLQSIVIDPGKYRQYLLNSVNHKQNQTKTNKQNHECGEKLWGGGGRWEGWEREKWRWVDKREWVIRAISMNCIQ